MMICKFHQRNLGKIDLVIEAVIHKWKNFKLSSNELRKSINFILVIISQTGVVLNLDSKKMKKKQRTNCTSNVFRSENVFAIVKRKAKSFMLDDSDCLSYCK